MRLSGTRGIFAAIGVVLTVFSNTFAAGVNGPADSPAGNSLWAHDNLFAYCVPPFDAKQRGPEERAQMLEKLGFKSFAFDWRMKDVALYDAEIEALQKHRINLIGWWFPFDADYPEAKATLEVFKRHHVHPQLWVVQHFPKEALAEWGMMPETAASRRASEEIMKTVLPDGKKMPTTEEESEQLSVDDQLQLWEITVGARFYNDSPKTEEGQKKRINEEAERIAAIVKVAAPYGSKVDLYAHNGWYGMAANEVAVIKRLKELGINDVGIIYNFSHARDARHDDTVAFPAVWKQIEPYVAAINITGTYADGVRVYPSQGDRELEMMRTIQDSGWRGPVGVIAEKGGDAEITLRNYLIGLDWLAAELKLSGSGGPRPFPIAP